MTIIEALKISDHIRRKGRASHSGSNGDGWVHVDMFLCAYFRLTKKDLLAEDWEAEQPRPDATESDKK